MHREMSYGFGYTEYGTHFLPSLVLFRNCLPFRRQVHDSDLLGMNLFRILTPLSYQVISTTGIPGKKTTHDILKRHGFLLGSDDSALDQEFVLAFDRQWWLLLHRLQHD